MRQKIGCPETFFPLVRPPPQRKTFSVVQRCTGCPSTEDNRKLILFLIALGTQQANGGLDIRSFAMSHPGRRRQRKPWLVLDALQISSANCSDISFLSLRLFRRLPPTSRTKIPSPYLFLSAFTGLHINVFPSNEGGDDHRSALTHPCLLAPVLK